MMRSNDINPQTGGVSKASSGGRWRNQRLRWCGQWRPLVDRSVPRLRRKWHRRSMARLSCNLQSDRERDWKVTQARVRVEPRGSASRTCTLTDERYSKTSIDVSCTNTCRCAGSGVRGRRSHPSYVMRTHQPIAHQPLQVAAASWLNARSPVCA